jgi:superfamily II DNA/RNA helicase
MPKAPDAPKSYAANAKVSNNNHGGADELGKRLKAVDYSKEKNVVASKWVVTNAKIKKHDISAILAKAKPSVAAAVTAENVLEWHRKNEVTIIGDNCPLPMAVFDDIVDLVPMSILKSFERQGFTAPTKVQALAWPILLQNRDIVGIAKTGSGKTLAFMIPAIIHIERQPPLKPGDGPIVVVLAPTRELALQIEEETRKVLPPNLRAACIYGGTPKGPQIILLNQGAHILIGTPGRCIDMLDIKRTNMLRTTFLVLDEADRMLDMGFEPQVSSICSQIRTDRQTLMFSATWPQEIQDMASQFQRDFIRINIGSMELTANTDVTQHFIFCSEHGKFAELRNLLMRHGQNKRVLIFAKMKKTTDELEAQLRRLGVNAMALHGDKEQKQREWILAKFKRDYNTCVIATDVAARGLDVKDLDVVINYDFPMQIDDYVHRIGRTGRAGCKGQAWTMLTKKEKQVTPFIVKKLLQIVTKAGQEVPDQLVSWAEEVGPVKGLAARDGKSRRGAVPEPSLDYKQGNRPSFMQAPPQPAAGMTFFGQAAPQPTNVPAHLLKTRR